MQTETIFAKLVFFHFNKSGTMMANVMSIGNFAIKGSGRLWMKEMNQCSSRISKGLEPYTVSVQAASL